MKIMRVNGKMLFIFHKNNSYSNIMAKPPSYHSIVRFLHFVIHYMAFWCNYTFRSYWVEGMCCRIENLFHNSLIIYYYLTLQYMKKTCPITVISILPSVKSITFHIFYIIWNVNDDIFSCVSPELLRTFRHQCGKGLVVWQTRELAAVAELSLFGRGTAGSLTLGKSARILQKSALDLVFLCVQAIFRWGRRF